VSEWAGDITLDELHREHPRWRAWRACDGLWYARPRDHPDGLVVRGEDRTDLRDEIRRAEALRG
jgi:hypothetical protein